MTSTVSLQEQLDQLRRGAEAIHTEDELRKKLGSDRQLRIKLGMDPTAPDIHLGHAVTLRRLRQFQDLGHKAVLIIGDYTARIGDPTGQDTTRPILGEQEIRDNAQTYLDQAGLILDLSPERFELRRNSEWLEHLSFADVLKLTGCFTVQQMLHRDSFRKRMEADRRIMVTEFMYPIMQAYDSVIVESDVELGGSDQTFNNLRGRDLMARYGMEPQVVLTMPLLVGLDGREKMSKTKGNTVGLTDSADDMFGKLMSVPDELMPSYLRLLTPLPEPRVASLADPEQNHPRHAKEALARIVVEQFHGAEAANTAAEQFRRRFSEGKLPDSMEVHTIDEARQPVAALLAEVGFASSKSEGRRAIKQGAVSFDGEKITDPTAEVTLPSDREAVLKLGKRRVCKVTAAG
jgi:tyrosyl-tRNA synthetase